MAGTIFEVKCKAAAQVVVMSSSGEVLAMEPARKHSSADSWLGAPDAPPEPLDDAALKKLLEENRFEGYMNQADEIPEP